MGKAVLVIDMPEHCDDCPLRVLWAKYHCVVNGKYCGDEDGYYSSLTKPSWCPLKSLPEKKETSYQLDTLNVRIQWQGNTFREGWNACIDEIVRGDENG